MRKPAFLQPRILRLAIISALSPAYTTKFPAVPFEPAPEFRGRPRYDADQCIGCGACAQVCPSKCIEVVDELAAEPPRRTLVQHFDACIMCGQCARYCPTGAGIRMSTDWDTAGFRPEDFEERVEMGEDAGGLSWQRTVETGQGKEYRFMKAIPTGAVCLPPH